MSKPQDLPEHVAKSILARATELDAKSPMMSVDELRAIAAELNVSPVSLEMALREHQQPVPNSTRARSRASLFVAALGLPIGVAAGSVLSTATPVTAAPLLMLVAGAGLLSSGALIVLQSKNPSLRSYISHNAALWGGVIAGGLSAIAVLGSGSLIELPWLMTISFGVKKWISSTVLGSAAVIAMRRGNVGKADNVHVQSLTGGPVEPGRSPSLLKRLLGWLSLPHRAKHQGRRIDGGLGQRSVAVSGNAS